MTKNLLSLSAVALLAAPISVARADLVFISPVTIGGTGLGAVNTVLTIQSQGNNTTEQGCVGLSGGADVIGNFSNSGCTAAANTDVKTGASQTQTRTLLEAGVTTGSNFAILFNPSEPGGDGISLDGLVATFYSNTGTILMTAVYTGTNPLNFPTTDTGTGNTGFEFTLNATEAAALQALITANGVGNIHVGLAGSAGNPLAATGGNETFFVFNSGLASTVPEPSTTVLMATGLLGLAGFVRRRRS
jgi:hypothetical protein